jgi:hypothetical protein
MHGRASTGSVSGTTRSSSRRPGGTHLFDRRVRHRRLPPRTVRGARRRGCPGSQARPRARRVGRPVRTSAAFPSDKPSILRARAMRRNRRFPVGLASDGNRGDQLLFQLGRAGDGRGEQQRLATNDAKPLEWLPGVSRCFNLAGAEYAPAPPPWGPSSFSRAPRNKSTLCSPTPSCGGNRVPASATTSAPSASCSTKAYAGSPARRSRSTRPAAQCRGTVRSVACAVGRWFESTDEGADSSNGGDAKRRESRHPVAVVERNRHRWHQ